MTLIIPPGYAQAAWKFSLVGDAEEMMVTCGIDLGAVTGDQDGADALSSVFADAFPSSEIISSYAYLGVRLAVGQDGGPPAVYESTVDAAQGSFSAAPLPQNCAFLVRKITALGGRSGRGRMYLPPFYLPEGSISATGFMTVEGQGNFQTLVNTWFSGSNPVVLHDSLSPVSTPTPITAFVVQRQIATQRRRLR